MKSNSEAVRLPLRRMDGIGVVLGVATLLLVGCAERLQPPPPLLLWSTPQPIYYPQPQAAPLPDVPPSYLVLLPNADGTTGQVTVQNQRGGRQTLNRPKQGGGLDGTAPPFPVTDQQLQRDFGAVMAARPLLPEHYRIYFASGDSSLTAESIAVLNTILARARQFSALEVSVVGHTDTRGDADANFALGLRRARAFAEILQAKGLNAVSLEIGSDGEELPLVPTPDNIAEPRNRRIEVTLR
jgi:outer membrane protein OmpA-like peptidoglycan-associated protein